MNQHRKNNKVQGALPCGNPKRYGSRDVVHMPALSLQDRKRKSNHDGDDNATESEKHLQTLLKRQINTDLSLTEQLSQQRSFSLATSHDPEVERLTGIRSLEKYKRVNDLDARIDYLRHCGLDDAEITLKLKDEFKDKVTAVPAGYGGDPQSKLQKLQDIERKIREKEESLKVPDTFKGALELSRHSLQLEKCLGQRQGKESSFNDIVTTQKKFEVTHPDDPVNHIHELLYDLEGKKVREPRRERRRKRKLERKKLYYATFNCDGNGNSGSGNGDDTADNPDDLDESLQPQHDEHSSEDLGLKHPPTTAGLTDETAPARLTDETAPARLTDETAPAGLTAETAPARLTDETAPAGLTDKTAPAGLTDVTAPAGLTAETVATDELPSCSLTAQACHQGKHSLGKHLIFTSENQRAHIRSESCPTSDSSKTVKTVNKPVQLISEDEIARNRLSLEEIRAIDKFQNYTEGDPNEVVYVKNLPNKTTEEDLIALFGAFQSQGKPRIVFKLLSGRMKGQAFITFPDTVTATRAVQMVNGYKLQGRPVILSFGKKHG